MDKLREIMNSLDGHQWGSIITAIAVLITLVGGVAEHVADQGRHEDDQRQIAVAVSKHHILRARIDSLIVRDSVEFRRLHALEARVRLLSHGARAMAQEPSPDAIVGPPAPPRRGTLMAALGRLMPWNWGATVGR